MQVIVRTVLVELGHFLTLEAGHAGPHDLVDKEKVGGDHGAAVYHLLLDSAIEIRYLIVTSHVKNIIYL